MLRRSLAKVTSDRGVLVGSLVLAFAASCRAAPIARVASPSDNGVDTYFGVRVEDPFRWMESDEPKLRAWLAEQNRVAVGHVSAIPGRSQLRARVEELSATTDRVGSVQRVNGAYFYLRRPAAAEVPGLYVRDIASGVERILVDPLGRSPGGAAYTIDYFSASPDGAHVAYGISRGGTEATVLEILETASGNRFVEKIDNATYGQPSWITSNSFVYTKLNASVTTGSPEAYELAHVFLHRLGHDSREDVRVFGHVTNPEIPFDKSDLPFVLSPDNSPFLVAYVTHGTSNDISIYAADRATASSGKAEWHKVVSQDDAVTAFDVHDTSLYVLTHRNAPLNSLNKYDLARRGDAATTVIPESKIILKQFVVASDAIYAVHSDGASDILSRKPFIGNDHALRMPTPQGSTITYALASKGAPGIVVALESWIQSAHWVEFGPNRSEAIETGLVPPSRVDFSNIVVTEARATSRDGTSIPLTIIHQKDLKLDGSHPVLMVGYGAYGLTLDPSFSSSRLAWLERGGVTAFAGVRGGGEFGEPWHRAGMKESKQNSIDDFLACAQFLVEKGYTSNTRLAGKASSAGAIVLGGAITQKPDWFGAAVFENGDCNPIRAELFTMGASNVAEYGSVKTLDGFRSLFAMDPYLHVRDGIRYPATLFEVAANDSRLPAWRSAKMAARMQQANSGDRPILMHVESDVGHVSGSTRTKALDKVADEYAFLFEQLVGAIPRASFH